MIRTLVFETEPQLESIPWWGKKIFKGGGSKRAFGGTKLY